MTLPVGVVKLHTLIMINGLGTLSISESLKYMLVVLSVTTDKKKHFFILILVIFACSCMYNIYVQLNIVYKL